MIRPILPNRMQLPHLITSSSPRQDCSPGPSQACKCSRHSHSELPPQPPGKDTAMPRVSSRIPSLSRMGKMSVCICKEQGKGVVWGLGPQLTLQDNHHICHPHFWQPESWDMDTGILGEWHSFSPRLFSADRKAKMAVKSHTLSTFPRSHLRFLCPGSRVSAQDHCVQSPALQMKVSSFYT